MLLHHTHPVVSNTSDNKGLDVHKVYMACSQFFLKDYTKLSQF